MPHQKSINRLIEPAIIFALLAYFFYLFGLIYSDAYFGRFSFPYQYSDLLNTKFLLRLIPIIIINIVVMIGFSSIIILICRIYGKNPINFNKFFLNIKSNVFGKMRPTTLEKRRAIYRNERMFDETVLYFSIMLSYFIFYYCMTSYKYIIFDYTDYIFAIFHLGDTPNAFVNVIAQIFSTYFILILLAVVSLILCICGTIFSLELDRMKESKFMIFVIIFTLISLFYINASIFNEIGAYDAIKLIEGAPGSYEIKLDLNESSTELSNNTLILVAQQDGNYYMVEKHKPAPPQSFLYVVPMDKIKMAKIIRIKS